MFTDVEVGGSKERPVSTYLQIVSSVDDVVEVVGHGVEVSVIYGTSAVLSVAATAMVYAGGLAVCAGGLVAGCAYCLCCCCVCCKSDD